METLLETLRGEYLQQIIESQYFQLDGQMFIVINVSSGDENNTPVAGRVFQCFGNKYQSLYKEIVFKNRYISIQVQNIKDYTLDGILENGKLVKIVYNKQDKQFKEE